MSAEDTYNITFDFAAQNKYLPRDDVYLFNTGMAERAYLLFGCHYFSELQMHRFVVWAPNAEAVSVVGDFNQWDENAHPMTRHEGGIFYAFIPGLTDGMIYKYCVQQKGGRLINKADPFAFHAETGPHTGSKIWSIDGFEWNDGSYLARRSKTNPHQQPISIYELHIGSWRKKEGERYPWYRSVADQLAAYCIDMGYTHVELLPITEYPFDQSWGYQVTGYFAPTSRYGTPQDFMYLVDTLHQHGIGVLIDWVPAHFPRDEHGLACFDGTPLYEHADARRANHPEWGTLIFDYGKPQVRSFLISAAMFFFDRYHIDGIRVDAVSSMLYLDYGRKRGEFQPADDGSVIDHAAESFLRRLNSTLLSAYPGTITIAEESTSFPLVSRPPHIGGLGFSFKWDMGFMHDTLDYFSMDPLFRKYHHDKLTFSMMYAYSESFILAFSHDEVVHGKCSLLNKMFGDYDQKFATLRVLFAYQYAHPGKKLNFMGSEFGQFIEWDHRHELDWHLLKYPRHAEMQRFMRELNQVYRNERALWQIDDSWDGFTWLNVEEKQHSCLAFLRRPADTEADSLLIAANFTPEKNHLVCGLPTDGCLQLLLNSDEYRFGGTNLTLPLPLVNHEPFADFSYHTELLLPPLSILYYHFSPISLKEVLFDADN